MRDFTPLERLKILEKLTPEEFFQLEPSYVHHPIGDKLNPNPTGFSVYIEGSDEGFLFDNLDAAIERMLAGDTQ